MIDIYEGNYNKGDNKNIVYQCFKCKAVFKINKKSRQSPKNFNNGISQRDTLMALTAAPLQQEIANDWNIIVKTNGCAALRAM